MNDLFRVNSNFENSNRYQSRLISDLILDNIIFKIYFFEKVPENFANEKFDVYEKKTDKLIYSFYGNTLCQEKKIVYGKCKLKMVPLNIYYRVLFRFVQQESNDNKITKTNVPKNLIQTHEDISKIPRELILCNLESNPEYKYYFFNKKAREKFLKRNFDESVLKAYNKLIPGAYKADLFRLCAVNILGGIYLDHKNVCNCTLDEIIPENVSFQLVNDTHYMNISNMIYNGCLIFEKNNSTCRKAVDLLVNKIINNDCIFDEPFADLQFGPTFFSKNFKFSKQMIDKQFYHYIPGHVVDRLKNRILIYTYYSSFPFDAANHYSRLFLQNKIYTK